jgi:hypothetical protein
MIGPFCGLTNGDHPSRHTAHRGDPGDEAALELLGIENGQDIAKMTMVWCAIFKPSFPLVGTIKPAEVLV